MVAVLIWSHTRGGCFACSIASPTARVEFTRESIICCKLALV